MLEALISPPKVGASGVTIQLTRHSTIWGCAQADSASKSTASRQGLNKIVLKE